MGGYLSIPQTVRKVLYVEPSVANVKKDVVGPEVKNGEWVVNEVVSKVENLIDYPVLHESDTLSEAPILESPSQGTQTDDSLKELEVNKKLKEDIQKELETIQEQLDILTTKQEEVKTPSIPPPITIPTEEERIPEFRDQANSSSHAIKKFNRRHRKH